MGGPSGRFVMQGNPVVFVDGVRTPFGRAGEKGMYWKTRADDLIVSAIIGLLERNPTIPRERIDDVAIAATTQEGDQGLTLGRTAAILAGLPLGVPGFAIDRMCAGAMTAVTTLAGGIAAGKIARGRVATVAIDQMGFVVPVKVGDIVSCYTEIQEVGRSSIQVGVEVWTSNNEHDERVKVTDGIFVFVAIDANGRTRPVPK